MVAGLVLFGIAVVADLIFLLFFLRHVLLY